jgi:hypothetical protein
MLDGNGAVSGIGCSNRRAARLEVLTEACSFGSQIGRFRPLRRVVLGVHLLAAWLLSPHVVLT